MENNLDPNQKNQSINNLSQQPIANKSEESDLNNNRSTLKYIFVYGLMVLLLASIVILIFKYQEIISPKNIPRLLPPSAISPSSPATETYENWFTYKSQKFPYLIKYPSNYQTQTLLTGNDRETIVFQNKIQNQEIIDFKISVNLESNLETSYYSQTATVSGIIWSITEQNATSSSESTKQTPQVILSTLHNGYVFNLLFSGVSKYTNKDLQQILNSFVFTDKIISNEISPTITIKTFTDPYIGYSIAYPVSWQLYQTYDPQKIKVDQAKIISGIELIKNSTTGIQASIVIHIIDAVQVSSLQNWIQNNSGFVPTKNQPDNVEFQGYVALKYAYQDFPDRQNEAIIFIKGRFLYKIIYMEKNQIQPSTREIVNSFNPK